MRAGAAPVAGSHGQIDPAISAQYSLAEGQRFHGATQDESGANTAQPDGAGDAAAARKGQKRELNQTKRAAQNRAAQVRAFRDSATSTISPPS